MWPTIAAVLLACFAGGAAALFVSGWFYLVRARRTHNRARARWNSYTADLVASKRLKRAYERGRRSRDGEQRYFARKWEGEHERAEEYLTELDRLKNQYGLDEREDF